MAKLKHKAKDVIKAIEGTGGIKTKIAVRLGVSRNTIESYLNRWDSVLEAYESEKSRIDDVAVSVVLGDIVNKKSVETAKWWLKAKMPKEFNPVNKVEHSGTIKQITVVKENRKKS